MRYAKEIIIDGVMVWKAAQRKVNPECTAEGNVLSTYTNVEYDAMNIGGSGGKSGCVGAGASTVSAGR